MDSQPRNLSIYLKDDDGAKKIGDTPFFYEFPRHKKIKLVAKVGEEESLSEMDCSFRFFSTIIGNGLWLHYGLLGVGYDLLSENAWDCPSSVQISWPYPIKALKAKCHRFLVLTPNLNSKAEALNVANKWAHEIHKEIDPCHDFVDLEIGWKLGERLHLDRQDVKNFNRIEDYKKRKIGNETKADVFVVLIAEKQKIDGEHLSVTATYIDMHTGSKITGFPESVILENASKNDIKEKILNFAFDLLPNSIGIESRDVTLKPVYHSRQVSAASYSWESLLSFLSRINLFSVISPEGYENGAGTFWFSPNLQLYPDYNSHDHAKPSKYPYRYAYHLLGSYHTGFTYFIPIGQLSMSFGLGPMLTYQRDLSDKGSLILNAYSSLALRYEVFLSKDFFIYFEKIHLEMIEKKHISSIEEVSLGLGGLFF